MAIPSQNDFINWRSDHVTKAFYLAMVERISEAKDILANQAGLNSADDNYYRGFIRAYQEALEFRIDDIMEDES